MTTSRLQGVAAILKHLCLSNGSESAYSSDNINPFVLRRILNHLFDSTSLYTRKKPCIIEFGARAGALGKRVSTEMPSVTYIGVEPFPPSNGNNFNIFSATCEEFLGSKLGRGIAEKADIFIYADVLEHLVDPWTHLNDLSKIAKYGSIIIASIPNILHHSCLSTLGQGRFDYEEWGVLDLTHLRFFTLTTMVELFTATGWHTDIRGVDHAIDPQGIKLIEGYNEGEERKIEFGNLIYVIRSATEAARLASYQYILTASKTR